MTTKTTCAKHCSVCEGQDHHWDYYGNEEEGEEPMLECKHCDAKKPIPDDWGDEE